jgi:hypothetical protein
MAGGATAKHYRMSEIKQKLLRPAQTSVYMVSVQTNPSVNSFVQDQARGYSPQRHQEMINLACCETSLPGSSLATHEVNNDYHGVTEKMAYRRIYDDTIDLTFYVDWEYQVIKYFQGWVNYIVGEGEYFSSEQYKNPATFYRMKYPEGPTGYKSDIHLIKFEKDVSKNSPRPTIQYQFIRAFPINIVSIPVSYDGSDVLKMTVSFAYTRYVITSAFNPYKDDSSSLPPVVGPSGPTGGQIQNLLGSPAQQSAFNNISFNPNAFGADLGFNPIPGAPELSGVFGSTEPTRVFQQSNLNNITSTAFSPTTNLF